MKKLVITLTIAAILAILSGDRPMSYADTVILKNGSAIHGSATTLNGQVTVDFGKAGRISFPESTVVKIIDDELNDFDPNGGAATPMPAAATKPVVVTLKKGRDMFGRGVYRGRVLPSQDDRTLRLRLPGGGTLKINRDTIDKIEDDADATRPTPAVAPGQRVIATTHLVTLTNGRKIRGNLVETPETEPLKIELGQLGTLMFRRDRVASVEPVAGTYELPAPPPAATEDQPPPPPALEDLKEQLREEILQDLLRTLIDDRIDRALEDGRATLGMRDITEGLDNETILEIQHHVYELGRQRTRNRTRAENALRRFGALALPYLQAAAIHPFELTRRAVQRLVRDIGDLRGVRYAIDALTDSDLFVRRHAHEALRSIIGPGIAYDPTAPASRRRAAQRQYRDLWQDVQRKYVARAAETRVY